MKDGCSCFRICLQCIQHAACRASRMEAHDFPTRVRAMLQNSCERRLLKREAAAHVRPSIKADFANILRLGKQVGEEGNLRVPFGNKLRVKAQSDAHSRATADQFSGSRPSFRGSGHREDVDAARLRAVEYRPRIREKVDVASLPHQPRPGRMALPNG